MCTLPIYIFYISCMHDKRKPYPLIMAKSISWHLCSLRYGSISWKLQSVNSFAIIPSTFGKKQLGRTLLFPLYAVDDVGSRWCTAGDANFAPNFSSSPDDCPIIIFFFGLSLSVNIGLVTLRGDILKLLRYVCSQYSVTSFSVSMCSKKFWH